MFVTGIILNTIIVLIIARVPIVWILGKSDRWAFCLLTYLPSFQASGTLATGCASLFFALIDPNASYWRFGFPSAILSVFGADFVFASGTIFVAKIVEPNEQSLSGALFQTMNQVSVDMKRDETQAELTLIVDWNSIGRNSHHHHLQSRGRTKFSENGCDCQRQR